MDRHRLAEERSLAYHRTIADKLARDPEILERARMRVAAWLERSPPPHYARAWSAVLARPLPDLVRFLLDEGDAARELRQSTPFAGALPPCECRRIWREVAVRRGAA